MCNRQLFFKLCQNLSKIVPEGKYKEILRLIFYKILSIPIGITTIEIKNTKIKLIKTITMIDNKNEVEDYLKFCNIKEGDVVLDCGAFYGVFAIFCAKNNKTGKVICIEPDPTAMKLLKKNIDINKCNNIEILNMGLGKTNQEMMLSAGGAGSTIYRKGITKVQIMKGDYLFQHMEKIDIIKMNIEGAEIDALNGMKDILKKFKPLLLIMADHEINGRITYFEVMDILKDIGYENITLTDKKMVVASWKK